MLGFDTLVDPPFRVYRLEWSGQEKSTAVGCCSRKGALSEGWNQAIAGIFSECIGGSDRAACSVKVCTAAAVLLGVGYSCLYVGSGRLLMALTSRRTQREVMLRATPTGDIDWLVGWLISKNFALIEFCSYFLIFVLVYSAFCFYFLSVSKWISIGRVAACVLFQQRVGYLFTRELSRFRIPSSGFVFELVVTVAPSLGNFERFRLRIVFVRVLNVCIL